MEVGRPTGTRFQAGDRPIRLPLAAPASIGQPVDEPHYPGSRPGCKFCVEGATCTVAVRGEGPAVSEFSRWSGGPVDGVRDPVIRLVVDRDIKLVAHFRPKR